MSAKNHIIETALELFSRNGYEKTSIREIAKAANISLGLMYNYFKSKEALLETILVDGMGDITLSFAFPKDSDEPLKTLVENIFRILQEKRRHWRLIHSIRMQESIMKKFEVEQEEIKGFILTEISLILESMGYQQPMPEAILLFATIDGLAGHFLMNEKYPIDRMAALLIEKYKVPHYD
ncbi:TetR/AcrR family transcriptional regulator [Catalinimonas niigatensis]|uniref:TetR/AcrR family transcriptional regulator n=1 Tax=Catalinimonas niigatensis TaxID=1397264 RepID=UPI002666294E|nr:TetR/AcrR family transcriptional regulator [Catalinimonas niigatensis]WPP48175.1 TetR/AcrR family transcriptional regulator [Catalinimonas niigatensis]